MDKQRFFEKFKSARRVIPVPLGDGEMIHVREITSAELSKFQLASVDRKGNAVGLGTYRERLIVLAACDADGKPIFSEADTDAIANLPASAIEPIVTAAQKLNRIGEVADPEDSKKN